MWKMYVTKIIFYRFLLYDHNDIFLMWIQWRSLKCSSQFSCYGGGVVYPLWALPRQWRRVSVSHSVEAILESRWNQCALWKEEWGSKVRGQRSDWCIEVSSQSTLATPEWVYSARLSPTCFNQTQQDQRGYFIKVLWILSTSSNNCSMSDTIDKHLMKCLYCYIFPGC